MGTDVDGTANVTGTMSSAAIKVPVTVKCFVLLCKNIPGSKATKPDDAVTAMNCKSIWIDNTDAEERLILLGALCYADTFKPRYVVDVTTLAGAIRVALGDRVADWQKDYLEVHTIFYSILLSS